MDYNSKDNLNKQAMDHLRSSFQNGQSTYIIDSADQLQSSFRPKDQNKVILPENFKFPLAVEYYISWREGSGVYTYLVAKFPHWDQARGIAFKRTRTSGDPVGGQCCWCNSYGTSDEIGLMSVSISSKESRSYYLCNDLNCLKKIEHFTTLAGRDTEKYYLELFFRIEKLFENVRMAQSEV